MESPLFHSHGVGGEAKLRMKVMGMMRRVLGLGRIQRARPEYILCITAVSTEGWILEGNSPPNISTWQRQQLFLFCYLLYFSDTEK